MCLPDHKSQLLYCYALIVIKSKHLKYKSIIATLYVFPPSDSVGEKNLRSEKPSNEFFYKLFANARTFEGNFQK